MIPHIKHVPAPANATPYIPSKYETVGATSTVDFEFTGRGGNVFGFDRILPGAKENLETLTATAWLNEDVLLFKDIPLSLLRTHFLHKKLLFPYIVQKNNTLRISVTNPAGTPNNVSILLPGYEAPHLAKVIDTYREKGVEMPRPVFLYASGEIDDTATSQPVDIPTKSVDVRMLRATADIDSTSDRAYTVSLQVWNEIVKNKVFVDQFNDEFATFYATVPFVISKNIPLSLSVDNIDGVNGRTLSFLGEAYVMSAGE